MGHRAKMMALGCLFVTAWVIAYFDTTLTPTPTYFKVGADIGAALAAPVHSRLARITGAS